MAQDEAEAVVGFVGDGIAGSGGFLEALEESEGGKVLALAEVEPEEGVGEDGAEVGDYGVHTDSHRDVMGR